ncbi:hypothetical protein BDY19DRAFT_220909 [Irpex rosettiformis]|uniref:Uncharacterized protein n=1 Tax=Irpex rosettiformis TaxID=378272 RepID=A0ACB8U0G4_9APHY|nr:hypothetical protein BDY19DRAFT_220909 [Irpex rosettiformis]
MIHTTKHTHNSTSAKVHSPSLRILPIPAADMRATFPPSPSRQSTPTLSSRGLDEPTPRQNMLTLAELEVEQLERPEDSGPIIYDSASRTLPSPQESPIFPAPSPRESLKSFGSADSCSILSLF